MNLGPGSLTFDLIFVASWGVALGFAYWVFARALELLPLGDDRRAALGRIRPLVGLGLSLVFCLFSAHAVFSRYESVLPVALLLVLVGFFMGSRSLVRDFFSGVAIRSEDSCRVGDHIRIGDTRGRVVELGPRAIILETPEGDQARVPYSQASQLPIIQTQGGDRGASQTFHVDSPSQLSFADIVSLVERTALSHHWASVARPPEVTTSSNEERLEITIFALAPDHASDVEFAVRKALKGADSA